MKYAFVNGIILDGSRDMKPLSGKAVITEGEKIEAIADAADLPEDCKIIDLGGKYLLPGLINMHVHIPASGKPKKGKTDYAKLAKLMQMGPVKLYVKDMMSRLVMDQLLSGTTTIRAVGGAQSFDTNLRNEINSGKKDGPRILACDYAVSVPGGHMTGSVALPAGSPDEAAVMVYELSKHNVDWIKLMITGGVLDAEIPGEPGVLKMPAEYIKAACDRAHELGYKVAAHVEGTEGLELALEYGVDSIEHGGKPSEKSRALFKEKDAALIATLSPAMPFAVMDPAVSGADEIGQINGKALMNNMIECIKACIEDGIRVGLGTDTGCPFVTHYDMWRELWYFNKYIGASPAECIWRATKLNAEIAGIGDITGSIEAGKCADMMIVEKDPLEDLTALRSAAMVVARGKIFQDPRPRHIKAVDEALDALM
ncbi:MAG: amidohydrolase family protein [Firmicutes bacterium]|nr:amidohydrolase family protein [Bacillota bacterium]